MTPEAFPAVTVPSSVNAGRSRARLAAVTSGRMCSSAATSTALHYLMMEALALVFPPRADMDCRYLLNSGSVQRQARAGPGQENRWPAASGLNQGDGRRARPRALVRIFPAVALLIAVIAGALLMATAGTARITQLRMVMRRDRRQPPQA